jgi:hypothetical protein
MRASKHLTVAIYAADLKSLREIVRTHSLDFGCRPHAISDPTGRYYTTALVSKSELDQLRKNDLDVRDLFDQVSPDRTAKATIGKGDRFKGGRIPPQGVGTQPEVRDDDLGLILNVDEVNSAIQGLVNEYGIPTFDVPNATSEGSGGKGGMVGPVNRDAYHIYFTAGVHARERGGPDNLIYFIADLLFAEKHSIGLTYGAKAYSNADVTRALRGGIVFFPLVNPDGVRYDQKTDSLWRKNRNPATAITTFYGTSGGTFTPQLQAQLALPPTSRPMIPIMGSWRFPSRKHAMWPGFSTNSLAFGGIWISIPPKATSCLIGEMTTTSSTTLRSNS